MEYRFPKKLQTLIFSLETQTKLKHPQIRQFWLEVTKNRLASLLEEREAFAAKLNQDNDSLQSLLEEAQRAKDALGNCIKALSMEKNELANRLALAEDEIVRLKSAQSGPIVQFDEIRGNIEDVAVINEGLSESLRQMKLKNPSFNDGISGQQ